MPVGRGLILGTMMLLMVGGTRAEPYTWSLPSNKFLVFLGCDSAELTPKAKEAVARAVARAKRWGTRRVLVTGFTDASRSDEISKDLSVRMARSVHADIVEGGVPTAIVYYGGAGKAAPLKPTADGVREPMNCRVEIVVEGLFD